jgi:hypothetical protein
VVLRGNPSLLSIYAGKPKNIVRLDLATGPIFEDGPLKINCLC